MSEVAECFRPRTKSEHIADAQAVATLLAVSLASAYRITDPNMLAEITDCVLTAAEMAVHNCREARN